MIAKPVTLTCRFDFMDAPRLQTPIRQKTIHLWCAQTPGVLIRFMFRRQ